MDLLPCPFCGCDNPARSDLSGLPTLYRVFCPRCFGTSHWFHDKDRADAAWNRRPSDPVVSVISPVSMPGLNLDELERLEQAATKAPWATEGSTVVALNLRTRPRVRYENGVSLPAEYAPALISESYDGEYIENPKATEDATLIATARNALPALLTTARNHERLLAAVEAVVRSSNPLAALAGLHDVYEQITKEPSNE